MPEITLIRRTNAPVMPNSDGVFAIPFDPYDYDDTGGQRLLFVDPSELAKMENPVIVDIKFKGGK